MHRKKRSIHGFQHYTKFQACTGRLGTYPLQVSGGATVL